MSKEEKINQFEKKQLNKLLIELKDIDNFKGFEDGAFKYNLGKYQASLLSEYIEQLQQENKELKQKIYSPDLTITTCPKCGEKYSINYCKEVYDLQQENKIISNILAEFEKWLEEQYSISFDPWFPKILNKLQELKEGKK